MIPLQQILAATDFSEPAAVALAYARRLARSCGAELHVLHVIEDIVDPEPTLTGGLAGVDRVQNQIEANARRQLEDLIGDDHRQGLYAEPVVVTSVSAARAILAYAVLHKIDLIVLGRHGDSGDSRLFMGSVAQHVVRAATCPVLTMKPPARSIFRGGQPAATDAHTGAVA